MNKQSLNRPYKPPTVPHKNRKMANKGKVSENIIDRVNKQYEITEIASIEKMPTPIKIMKVHNDGKVEGFTEKGYLVDYSGVYNGRMVAFDMKECRNKTSFPLTNVKAHQYTNLRRKHNCGAHSFLIVHKVELKKWYRIPFEVLDRFWVDWKTNEGRKSIPQEVFDTECVEIKPTLKYMLHYLEGLD